MQTSNSLSLFLSLSLLLYNMYIMCSLSLSISIYTTLYPPLSLTHTHTHSSDKAAAEALAEKVEEASKLLTEYNKRLERELKERLELQELLEAFIWQQKKLLKEAKRTLKDFQSKQEKVTSVKEELKSHLANLPDLSKLPMGSKTSLTPLPSVGDLFT